jgi:hypothetical protein
MAAAKKKKKTAAKKKKPATKKKEKAKKPPATIDEIVARWKAGHYPPRPPAPPEVRAAFFAEVRARCGFDPPADYHRFLELCDGGQNNAVWMFGAAPNTSSHYDPTKNFLIGDSGNVDLYILRPDGRAEVTDFSEAYAYEKYPTFRAMLDKLIRY